MKKAILSLVAICVLASALTGCGVTMMTSPTVGGIYTNTTSPTTVTTDPAVSASKKGVAECMSVLAIVAWGHCGVEDAMRNGKITKVKHVDHDTFSVVLGVYSKYTTTVYGE